VIANASEAVLTELRFLLATRNDAIFSCVLGRNNRISNVELVGRLDDKQSMTLALVKQFKEVDTSLLVERGCDRGVRATAWNNRLAALATKGLVMEAAGGRAKRFRLPV
jgi:hypothetical protein